MSLPETLREPIRERVYAKTPGKKSIYTKPSKILVLRKHYFHSDTLPSVSIGKITASNNEI